MDTLTFENELVGLQSKLFAFAYQLTSNKEDAQDLVQETSLKILNNASKFVNEQNFKGWSLTIMKNIFINNYRKFSKRKTITDTSDNEFLLNLKTVFAPETPDSLYSTKEINYIINSFAPEFRIPFKYYISGYSYQEIAETINIPLGTVKSRIFFARKKLQKLLKDYK